VVSIIVPLFQGGRYIGELLASLTTQVDAPSFEVIIADNGSTDGGQHIVAGFQVELAVRVIDASAERGQTFARNRGAAVATGQQLLFLDQDDVVSDRYVASMSTALAADGVVGARVDLSRLNPGWRAQVRRLAQETALASGPPFPWAYGGTLGVRRELFAAVGGFDERLVVAAEDEDLCWRLQAAGASLAFVPEAVLHYRLPNSWRALFRQGRRYGRAQVQVDSMHRSSGRTLPKVAPELSRLVLEAPRALAARSQAARWKFAFLAGRRLGTLRGLLEVRTPRGSRRYGCVLPIPTAGPHQ